MKKFLELMDGSKVDIIIRQEPQPQPTELVKTSLLEEGYTIASDNAPLTWESHASWYTREVNVVSESDIASLALLAKHAQLLIDNFERIKSDSRIFLAPVPLPGGTFGCSATLGIMVEWWKNYKCANFIDDAGRTYPIYAWGGSYLSGMNACKCVDANGNFYRFSAKSYRNIFLSFIEVASRYKQAIEIGESYPIDRAIALATQDI